MIVCIYIYIIYIHAYMLYTYQFLFTNPEFPRRFQKRIQKNSKQGFPRGKEYLGSPNGNPCADHLEEWQARYLPGRQAEATKPPEVFHGFQTGKFPSIFQLPGFEGWKVSSTFRKFKKKTPTSQPSSSFQKICSSSFFVGVAFLSMGHPQPWSHTVVRLKSRGRRSIGASKGRRKAPKFHAPKRSHGSCSFGNHPFFLRKRCESLGAS